MSAVSETVFNRRDGSRLSLAGLRAEFPILSITTPGGPLVYLDNAASSQKPKAVLDRIQRYYTEENANIHRGVHHLSQVATEAYENARKTIAAFLGATNPSEVIFTRGATEGINLVVNGLEHTILKGGGEILLTGMEHHANIVPWQMAAERTGAVIKVAPVLDDGSLDVDAMIAMITPQTKVVGVVWVSNALGTINPVERIIAAAKAVGAQVLVDACQAITHFDLDVAKLDADYVVFSGHKLFAPTGIGILWGKAERLSALPPYQGGGDMIQRVSFSGTTYRGIPERFEAGTPHIEGAIGLAAAVDWLRQFDRKELEAHEAALLRRAEELADGVPGLRRLSRSPNRCGVLSFVMDGTHPHDIGTFLDASGIAVRTGHHCCMPLMERFGIPGTTRASFAFYNTLEEVEALGRSLRRVAKFFVV